MVLEDELYAQLVMYLHAVMCMRRSGSLSSDEDYEELVVAGYEVFGFDDRLLANRVDAEWDRLHSAVNDDEG